MLALRRQFGVGEVIAQLCHYIFATRWRDGEPMPAQKPTRFLSSVSELLKLFGQR